MRIFPGLLVLCAVALQPAQASVFKCTDSSGKVSFTDRPCPTGSDTEALAIRATDPNQPPPTPGARERQRDCAQIARPAWDLLPREASGQLDASEARQLQDAREQLANQCQQRLTTSPLAYECREQLTVLTRATARAVDPQFAAERDRLQAEFDRRCGDEAVLLDIVGHLRDLDGSAPAPDPDSPQ